MMKKRIGSIVIVICFAILMLGVAFLQKESIMGWKDNLKEKKLDRKEQDLLVQGADFVVQNLKVEFVENPIGLDITNPSFSWKLASDKENIKQYAYRVQVYEQSMPGETEKIVWDSGFVQSMLT